MSLNFCDEKAAQDYFRDRDSGLYEDWSMYSYWDKVDVEYLKQMKQDEEDLWSQISRKFAGKARRRNLLNRKHRGSNCAQAIWLNSMSHPDCNYHESKLGKIKTNNGKHIRGFRAIEPDLLDYEDEIHGVFRDDDFDAWEAEKIWSDYIEEEEQRFFDEIDARALEEDLSDYDHSHDDGYWDDVADWDEAHKASIGA